MVNNRENRTTVPLNIKVFSLLVVATVCLSACVLGTEHIVGGLIKGSFEALSDAVSSKPGPTFYGFINRKGKWIIEPKFQYASDFKKGFATACLEHDQCGLIDTSDRFVIEPIYKNVHYSEEATFALGEGGYVVYDEKQNMILNQHRINPAVLDPWGRSLFKTTPVYFEYEKLCIQSKNLIPAYISAQDKKRYGYMNWKGEFTIKPAYDEVSLFSEGLAHVRLQSKSEATYIDESGKVIFKIPGNPDECGCFLEGRAVIKYEKNCRYITRDGRFLPSSYQKCNDFSEGLALVQVSNKKWGYIGLDGSIVIPPVFDKAYSFSEGLASVSSNGNPSYAI